MDNHTLDRWLAESDALLHLLTSMHAAGEVHGDLTPNALAEGDGGPRILRSDHPPLVGGALTRNPRYLPPERLVAERPATPAGDVFALGAILAERLTGTYPFAAPTPIAEIARAAQGPPALDLAAATPRRRAALALLEEMLHPDPARRPTAAEALDRVRALRAQA